MRPAAIRGPLPLIGFLFAVAACGGGDGGGLLPPPPAPVSTLAYIVTRCHEAKGGAGGSFSQALWVRQRDGAPVKIADLALGQPPIGGLCRLLGQNRNGAASTYDPLGMNPNRGEQAFAIRPDGSELVQLTQTQGMIRNADGSIDVELPGPFRAAAYFR